MDQRLELLHRAGKICEWPGCPYEKMVEPCLSYGHCRITIYPQDGDSECFVVGVVAMKRKKYCYYHDKFFNGRNLSAGNEIKEAKAVHSEAQ